MSVNEKMTAIADNIRSKTEKTEALSLDDMASGVNEVFEAGKKTQYDEFWNTYLAPMRAGRPANYLFAGPGWNGNTFYPNQDIIIIKENASGLFNRFSWNSFLPSIDLAQRLEDCGVVLDISTATTIASMFEYAYITRVPSLNCSKLTYPNLTNVFAYAIYLQIIDELILSDDGLNTFPNTFNGCTALKKIKFTGVIGETINFSACPLEVASLKNIIEHLKDYAGTANEYKKTLTVKTSAFSVLEAEGATAEYNGVTCTWAELIDNKKWNLVKA